MSKHMSKILYTTVVHSKLRIAAITNLTLITKVTVYRDKNLHSGLLVFFMYKKQNTEQRYNLHIIF